MNAHNNNLIQIYCTNTERHYDVPRGSSLLEIYDMIGLKLPYRAVAARVNYRLEDLNYYVYKPKNIEFVDISCAAGMRCYVRTLSIVLVAAIKKNFPEADLRIEHPISKGYYCRL